MNVKIGKESIPCSICRKEYEATVIDYHITYPHICDNCIKEIVKEWSQKEELYGPAQAQLDGDCGEGREAAAEE